MTPIRELMAKAAMRARCEILGFTDSEGAIISGDDWHQYLPEIDAAIAALYEAGYTFVQREPSEAMVDAHIEECAGDADEAGPERVRDCWHQMVKAAERDQAEAHGC